MSASMSSSYAPPAAPLLTAVDVHCTVGRSRAGAERLVPRTELVFVRRGLFVTHFGSRSIVADPNQVLAVDGGSAVRFSHPTDDGDRYTGIELSPGLARELLAAYQPALQDRVRTPFPTTHLPVTPEIHFDLQRLRRSMRRAEPDVLHHDERALRLAERVVAIGYRVAGRFRAPREEPRPARRELAERVRQVLAEHPAASTSLAELAARVGASPFHLARTFRRETGLPIHRYRLRLRLALALDRIAEGESNLSLLGFELGFSSHSHFTRQFRAVYGQPPARLRELLARDSAQPVA
ncbi:MAG: AraC family transcriptional regulator [Gemmatimonadales bacterium]